MIQPRYPLPGPSDHGKSAKELAGLFGYNEEALRQQVALGFIPNVSKLYGQSRTGEELGIGQKEARLHLLPLRVWPVDVLKNDKALDYSLYDYTEVTTAIDKLVDGAFSPVTVLTIRAQSLSNSLRFRIPHPWLKTISGYLIRFPLT